MEFGAVLGERVVAVTVVPRDDVRHARRARSGASGDGAAVDAATRARGNPVGFTSGASTRPMVEVELTESQRELLATLVAAHRESESTVTASTLGESVGRNPATIRNQIQSLKALGLVEGIPGPRGGYKPTTDAYEVLDSEGIDDPESVTLARDYDRVDITVEGIDLTGVNDPEACVARLQFSESVAGIGAGDPIAVGPTPVSGLTLAGEVTAVEESSNTVTVDVARLEAPLREE